MNQRSRAGHATAGLRMANNRMYLRCNTCGAEQFLAKYYPSTSWGTCPDLVDYNKVICDFICEHSELNHLPKGTNYVNGDGAFSISYECEERVKERRVFEGTAKYDKHFAQPIIEQADYDGINEITPDQVLPANVYGKPVRVTVDILASRTDDSDK